MTSAPMEAHDHRPPAAPDPVLKADAKARNDSISGVAVAIGVTEHALDQFVSRVTEGLCETSCDGVPEVVGGDFLGNLWPVSALGRGAAYV